jgi:periplasmic divalent cation tolerance protein
MLRNVGCEGLIPLIRLAQLDQDDKPVLIYSTWPSVAEAERIGGALVDRGLAACVNILHGMTAIYVWEGKRQRDSEAAMLIKTRAGLADIAIAEARKLHPYDNPAFVVLPIDGGSADFLRWILEQTAKPA